MALPAARCHESKGERQSQLAAWISFTLGGLSKVEAIVVEEIVDYH
jgi:hypothetical protein